MVEGYVPFYAPVNIPAVPAVVFDAPAPVPVATVLQAPTPIPFNKVTPSNVVDVYHLAGLFAFDPHLFVTGYQTFSLKRVLDI